MAFFVQIYKPNKQNGREKKGMSMKKLRNIYGFCLVKCIN